MLSLEELYRGRRCTVFALVVDGRSQVLDYLNGLPRPQFDKMETLTRRLADNGLVANKEKFRRLNAGVYEMKLWNPPKRIFCFRDGPNWICTHGERKPGERELQSHIAKVRALRQRYLRERT